jgi:hypothetical protein
MSTRAIQFLKQKKIPFEIIENDHEEKGAEFQVSGKNCDPLV